MVAYGLFFGTSSFGWWALAQGGVAVGLSFASGTDTSWLHETLVSQGRAEEYGELEARLGAWGSGSMAAGAIIGGLVASVAPMGWAYGISAIVGVVGLGAAAFAAGSLRVATARMCATGQSRSFGHADR